MEYGVAVGKYNLYQDFLCCTKIYQYEFQFSKLHCNCISIQINACNFQGEFIQIEKSGVHTNNKRCLQYCTQLQRTQRDVTALPMEGKIIYKRSYIFMLYPQLSLVHMDAI